MVADPFGKSPAPTRRDAAFYIHEMAGELALMAQRAGMDGLAHLLEAAKAQAAREARDDGGRR
jgi:hypothetical protein